MFFHHSFKILDGLGERLKAEREARGLSQRNLAAVGNVTRFTQAGYESEATSPNTAYLKAIQETEVDLHFILTGKHQSAGKEAQGSPPEIDWERLRTAYEDVEFFCDRAAPKCPSRYRWMMVAELYSRQVKLGGTPLGVAQANKETMGFLSSILANYV